jgi:hypothetical protein
MDSLPWNIHRRDSSENLSHILYFVALIYVPKKKSNGPNFIEDKWMRENLFSQLLYF